MIQLVSLFNKSRTKYFSTVRQWTILFKWMSVMWLLNDSGLPFVALIHCSIFPQICIVTALCTCTIEAIHSFQTRIERKGQPYGTCVDPKEYFKQNGIRFSTQVLKSYIIFILYTIYWSLFNLFVRLYWWMLVVKLFLWSVPLFDIFDKSWYSFIIRT